MLGKNLKKLIVKILIVAIISIGSILGYNTYQDMKSTAHMNKIVLKQMKDENGKLKAQNKDYIKAIKDYEKLDEDARLIEQSIRQCFDLRLIRLNYRHTDRLHKTVLGHTSKERIVDMTYRVNVMLEDFNEIKIIKDTKKMCIVIELPDDFSIEVGKIKDMSYDGKQSPLANPYSASYLQGYEDSVTEKINNKMNEALRKNSRLNADKITVEQANTIDMGKGLRANAVDSFKVGMESLVKSLGIDNIVFK